MKLAHVTSLDTRAQRLGLFFYNAPVKCVRVDYSACSALKWFSKSAGSMWETTPGPHTDVWRVRAPMEHVFYYVGGYRSLLFPPPRVPWL